MNCRKVLFVISFVLFYPYSIFAENNVKPKIKLPDFHFAYNYEVKRSDDGLYKDAGTDKGTITNRLRDLRVGLSGEGTKNFFYDIEFNGANTSEVNTAIIDHAELKLVHNKFTFVIGTPKGSVYGWRQKLNGPMDYTNSASNSSSPWGRTDTAQVSYNLGGAGSLTLQSARDTETNTSFNTRENSNATTFEWMGNFNGFSPLLQYASYDEGHSNTGTVGLRYKNEKLDVRFDYISDMKYTNVSSEKDTHTGINLEGYYYFNDVEAFLLYSTFDKTQNGTDIKRNDTTAAYDDNKQTMALGGTYLGHGTGFKPYFVYVINSGKFLDTNSSISTFKENHISVGIKGSW